MQKLSSLAYVHVSFSVENLKWWNSPAILASKQKTWIRKQGTKQNREKSREEALPNNLGGIFKKDRQPFSKGTI